MRVGEKVERFVHVRVGERAYARVWFESDSLASAMAHYFVASVPEDDWTKYSVEVSRTEAIQGVLVPDIVATGPGFAFSYSRARRSGDAILREPLSSTPTWQVVTPVRQILAWVIDHEGGALLHASGIYVSGKKVALFAGPSGSGKSTLAASIAKRPGQWLSCLGDDWVPVWKGRDGRWYAAPLYRSLKLTPEMAEHLGMKNNTGLRHKDKVVIKSADMVRSGEYEVGAVFVPTIAPEGLSVKGMDPFDALHAIAPSTVLQSMGVGPGTLKAVSGLVRALPCYELSVGLDMLNVVPDMIGGLL